MVRKDRHRLLLGRCSASGLQGPFKPLITHMSQQGVVDPKPSSPKPIKLKLKAFLPPTVGGWRICLTIDASLPPQP